MIDTEPQSQYTSLYKEHLHLKAKLIPFAGWLMPVQYDGIIAEYQQTRSSVSLFDTSHMGEFLIDADAVSSGLDRIVTQRIVDMPNQTCRYGTMLNEQGGIIDDLIVYRMAEKKWMIVVNAGEINKKAEYFERQLKSGSQFQNISCKTGKLDLQGPMARDVLSPLVPDIGRLEYFMFDEFFLLGEKVFISRTGYTGELGYEIYIPWEKTAAIWRGLLENKNIKPAGLGARDILRLEMGYSLYGNDLDVTILPLEAGLNTFIDFEKDFIGKSALLERKQSGVNRKMIFFKSQGRQSPRHLHKIFSPEGKEIGFVTSGTFSPELKCGIGMGLVDRACDLKDKEFFVGDEKSKIKVELAHRPFYKKGSLKT